MGEEANTCAVFAVFDLVVLYCCLSFEQSLVQSNYTAFVQNCEEVVMQL